ncbi:unnamed protein product [Adineta steineri]|uniref:NAD(P)(+)--arginine ADP-ribosyltransferase n=1 Tax=Adineta steineri TaxID=433720 RepID=A0A819Y1K9_9BILA|nr:unnamed protein product [Adineta steineri]CAF4143607.1 unnamed protein product [Adineta steineri]
MATSSTKHSAQANNLSKSRYTDIKDEPVGKLLMPIDGYQNEPLLTLEEALSSFSNFFVDLKQNIWIAKCNCKNPSDGLTQDESAAIHLYTMEFKSGDSLYKVLNRLLRTEKRDHLVPWFKFLKLFITALLKLNPVSATVWRGVRGEDLSLQYPTGRQFAWWGISSCTTTPDVLQTTNFLGKSGTRTLFSIECVNAKLIKTHSHYSETEKEIVLMPGTFFEVVGQVNPAEGLHIIHLKEIQPPFPLLKLPSNQQQISTRTQEKYKPDSESKSIKPSSATPLVKGSTKEGSLLNFDKLKDVPRLCMPVKSSDFCMAASVLGRKSQYLEMIRLSETNLGIMLNQHDIERNWFELRQPDDMSVLHSTDLVYNDYVHRVVALPKNEFIINVHGGNELSVLIKNRVLKPSIQPYTADKGIVSTAFISDKNCLVIQTNEPRELHFYDL